MFNSIKKIIQNFNAKRELTKYAPELNYEAENLKIEDLIDLIYSKKWARFFWILQNKLEITSLVKAVAGLKPKIIVEIGTNMGGSLFYFTKVADSEALIISIDLPGGLGGGGYPDYRTDFYYSFKSSKQKMLLWRLDSHLNATLETLKNTLGDQKIDFLFLDADHSYEGIKQDFEMFSPLVRKDGVIAFHDIKHTEPDNWIQVDKFWNEIKKEYKHEEFIDTSTKWGGIGIVYQK